MFKLAKMTENNIYFEADDVTTDHTECIVAINYPKTPALSEEQFIIKFDQLVNALSRNFHGCGAKWCIFVETAFSHRCDTVLVPFLPPFITSMEFLLHIINQTPTLKYLLSHAQKKDYDCCNKFVILLLHFVLVEFNGPQLQEVVREDMVYLKDILREENDGYVPVFGFKVCYSSSSTEEERFKASCSSYATKYAYFGCNPDNLYTILCAGMNAYKGCNKYGGKMCLSNEAFVFLKDFCETPYMEGLFCDQYVKVLLICEYVDRPEYIISTTDMELNSVQVLIDSPDMVRCRYLVFFGEQLTLVSSASERSIEMPASKSNYLVPKGSFLIWVAAITYIYRTNLRSLWMFVSQKFGQYFTFMQ